MGHPNLQANLSTPQTQKWTLSTLRVLSREFLRIYADLSLNTKTLTLDVVHVPRPSQLGMTVSWSLKRPKPTRNVENLFSNILLACVVTASTYRVVYTLYFAYMENIFHHHHWHASLFVSIFLIVLVPKDATLNPNVYRYYLSPLNWTNATAILMNVLHMYYVTSTDRRVGRYDEIWGDWRLGNVPRILVEQLAMWNWNELYLTITCFYSIVSSRRRRQRLVTNIDRKWLLNTDSEIVKLPSLW